MIQVANGNSTDFYQLLDTTAGQQAPSLLNASSPDYTPPTEPPIQVPPVDTGLKSTVNFDSFTKDKEIRNVVFDFTEEPEGLLKKGKELADKHNGKVSVKVWLGEGHDLPFKHEDGSPISDNEIKTTAENILYKNGYLTPTEPTLVSSEDRAPSIGGSTEGYEESLWDKQPSVGSTAFDAFADVVNPYLAGTEYGEIGTDTPQWEKDELVPKRFTHPKNPEQQLTNDQAVEIYGFPNKVEQYKSDFPLFHEDVFETPPMSQTEKFMKGVEGLTYLMGGGAGMVVTKATGAKWLGSDFAKKLFSKVTPMSGGKVDMYGTSVQNVMRNLFPAYGDLVIQATKPAAKFALSIQPTALFSGGAAWLTDKTAKRIAASETGFYENSELFAGYYIDEQGELTRYDAGVYADTVNGINPNPSQSDVETHFDNITEQNLDKASEKAVKTGKLFYGFTLAGETLLAGIWKLIKPNVGLMDEESKALQKFAQETEFGGIPLPLMPKELIGKDPLFLENFSKAFRITGANPKQVDAIANILEAPPNQVNTLLRETILAEIAKDASDATATAASTAARAADEFEKTIKGMFADTISGKIPKTKIRQEVDIVSPSGKVIKTTEASKKGYREPTTVIEDVIRKSGIWDETDEVFKVTDKAKIKEIEELKVRFLENYKPTGKPQIFDPRSIRDYGMFSDKGNRIVDELIRVAETNKNTLESPYQAVLAQLGVLSKSNPKKYGEALDSMIAEEVFEEMASRGLIKAGDDAVGDLPISQMRTLDDLIIKNKGEAPFGNLDDIAIGAERTNIPMERKYPEIFGLESKNEWKDFHVTERIEDLFSMSTKRIDELKQQATTKQRKRSSHYLDGEKLFENWERMSKAGMFDDLSKATRERLRNLVVYVDRVGDNLGGEPASLLKSMSPSIRDNAGRLITVMPLVSEDLFTGGGVGTPFTQTTPADVAIVGTLIGSAHFLQRAISNPRSMLSRWLTKGYLDSSATTAAINAIANNEIKARGIGMWGEGDEQFASSALLSDLKSNLTPPEQQFPEPNMFNSGKPLTEQLAENVLFPAVDKFKGVEY